MAKDPASPVRLRFRLGAVVALVALVAFGVAGCIGPGVHPVGPPDSPGASAGLWRSDGSDGSDGGCVWTRFAPDGRMIATDQASNGQRYVEIGADDGAFVQHGCVPFLEVDVPDSSWPQHSLKTFGDGDYLVWRDIGSGMWWAPGAAPLPDCEWQRLRGFGGTDADVIETGTRPSVYLDLDDVGFRSRGCGTWEMWLNV